MGLAERKEVVKWREVVRAKQEGDSKNGRGWHCEPRVVICNSRMGEAACWKVWQTYINLVSVLWIGKPSEKPY